jgi:drug/metabolite transporter (DMT)-like permease
VDKAGTAARTNLGILFLVASNGLTAVVDAIAKLMTAGMHPMLIVWGYFLGIGVLLAGYAVVKRIPLARLATTRHRPLQMVRSALLVGTISFLFLGLAYMPLADAFAITFMAPLFITILAGPILGERVAVHRVGAVVAGLIGVIVIMQPGTGVFHWAAMLILVSALCFALFQIATRRLVGAAPTMVTLYYTGFGGLLWISLMVGFFWSPIGLRELAVFIALGSLGIAAHVCVIKAFDEAQVSLLAPFNYAKLLWGIVLGYALFGDVPTVTVLAGSAIIVASGLYILWHDNRGRA